MTLSLLALFMLPVQFKFVLDPKGVRRFLKEWEDSSALQFFSVLLLFLLSMLILTTSEVHFKWSLDSILSWMAALIAVKAVSHFFPSAVAWHLRFMTEEHIPFFGFIGLLISLGLVYIDTQLL